MIENIITLPIKYNNNMIFHVTNSIAKFSFKQILCIKNSKYTF